MFENINVLVVEDDSATRYLCEVLLEKQGCHITSVAQLKGVEKVLERNDFDLLIVDLNLPDGDGLSLVQKVRSDTATPILIMTGRQAPEQRFEGFEAGATDYLIKPFHPGELLHRVRVLLVGKQAQNSSEDAYISFGNWLLNLSKRTLSTRTGELIDTTQGEFDLLLALSSAKGRVVSRLDLLDAITRGESDGHPRTVDVLISRLRKKLGSDLGESCQIITVPKLGYRLGLTTP